MRFSCIKTCAPSQGAALERYCGVLMMSASLALASQGCGTVSGPRDSLITPQQASSVKSAVEQNRSPETTPAHSFRHEAPMIAKLPPAADSEPTPPVESMPESTPAPAIVESGLASWYGGPKFHGRLTASGEIFNQEKLTAAHRTLPWGSRVKITNLANGRSVVVRINDRGPFVKGRIIDVSLAAARALGMVQAGVTQVSVERLVDPELSDLALEDNAR